MLMIIDDRAGDRIKQSLSGIGELLCLKPNKNVYKSISAHPDIFFCDCGEFFVVSPNMDKQVYQKLDSYGVKYFIGKNIPENNHPNTSFYNAVVTDDYLIHNLNFTDKVILEKCANKKHIHINQSYTRCSLIEINNEFFTSDKGIEKQLLAHKLKVHYFDAEDIKLQGHKNGFLGGCLGIHNNKLYCMGNPMLHKWHAEFYSKVEKLGVKVVVLDENIPLTDNGSLLIN